MATKWALSAGNWSEPSRWNDGVKPVAGDVVFANGRTVLIDEDIVVDELNSGMSPDGNEGGTFSTVGSVTVHATMRGGTTTCLTVNYLSVCNGDSYGGYAQSANGTIVHGVINGNAYCGTSNACYGLRAYFGGIHNGDSYAGSTEGASGAYIFQGGIQNGNAYGSDTLQSWGSVVLQGGKMFGNAFGGTEGGCYGAYVSQGGLFVGNAYGAELPNSGMGVRVLTGGFAVIRECEGRPGVPGVYSNGNGQVCVVDRDLGDGSLIMGATDVSYETIGWLKPAIDDIEALLRGNRLGKRGVCLS